MKPERIAIIGTGYVGLVTGACFASLGHRVVCYDTDKKKILDLRKGKMPFFEPGLKELIQRMTRKGTLHFSLDLDQTVQRSRVIFITVGTPSRQDGSVDLSYVKAATADVARYLRGGEIIVSKSTVPVGASHLVRRIVKKHFKGNFSVISNPEFLREGVAISTFLKQDRVIIGYEPETSLQVKRVIRSLYRPLHAPLIETNNRTAELIKYAANVFLASEISFINSIARLCEEIGADVELVSEALKADPRIGKKAFLSAGIGYGGLCFPKDIRALIRISRRIGYRFEFLDVVERVNKEQRKVFVDKMRRLLGTLKGKRVALLGLAFKPDTDDMRDAPSVDIIRRLLRAGARVHVTDPVALSVGRRIFGMSIRYSRSPYDALRGAQIAGFVTEWPVYRTLDFSRVKKIMSSAKIVDGRNMFDPEKMRKSGFAYQAIGRGGD